MFSINLFVIAGKKSKQFKIEFKIEFQRLWQLFIASKYIMTYRLGHNTDMSRNPKQSLKIFKSNKLFFCEIHYARMQKYWWTKQLLKVSKPQKKRNSPEQMPPIKPADELPKKWFEIRNQSQEPQEIVERNHNRLNLARVRST